MFLRTAFYLALKGLCLLILTGVLCIDSLFAQERTNLSVEATRISGQITVDGRLDKPEWNLAPLITGFRQVEPNQGEPALYDSEVRVLYNDDYIYIGAKLYDDPGERPRVSSLSRNFDYFENDLFGVVFDTFNNERDAISFQVTPYGNQRDLQVFDDAVFNRDFDVVWYAETQITDEGWTVEMAIPWRSLRYSEENGTWGINFVRRHRRSNEESAWSPWPRAYTAYRMPYAGKITGFRPPPPSMNLRVQPYTLVQTNRTYDGNFTSPDPKLGGEIKWAPTRNSVLDVTFNTDFAQVEADQQVINLTRFPVVFPEKRQFFLENANLFDIGRVSWLKPFFSRRIGLTETGEPVPLDAGFRFTEQSVERSFGALLMRQRGMDDISPAWFGVGRYLENFGSNKRAGLMFTARHDESGAGLPSRNNLTGNADTFMRFPSNITFAANAGASFDSDLNKWGHAGDLWLSYLDNLMYLGLLQAVVSPDYRPGTGVVGRRDVIMTSPAVSFNFRPNWRPEAVRAFTPGITTFFYHTYSSLEFEQGYVALRPLSIQFNNGSRLQHSWLFEWHRLDRTFSPAGITVAAGRYDFRQHEIQFNTDQSASFTFTALAKHGGYFDGSLTQTNVSAGFRTIPNIYIQSRYIRNMFRDLGLESQNRNVDLVITNVRLALNPRLHLSGFLQHNTDLNVNLINVRFSWEFSPLSYLYLVFNDVHPIGDDLDMRPPGRQQAIFKLTYLKQL